MIRPLRIGSRGSQLALWQANHIASALRGFGHAVDIQIIKTTGDRLQDPAFRAAVAGQGVEDGKGIFIKEIEEALAAGAIDLAVHSLKDLPTELAPEFTIAAIPPRVDPRDVLVAPMKVGLRELCASPRIGTTSPRRQTQLLALRDDLRFIEMRGNVDTRLRKLNEGQAEALVLAAAGLDRLGLTEHISQRFAITELCPAPGQGALAVECRASDAIVKIALTQLDDEATRFAVTAERAGLGALGGGCSVPIGIFCEVAAGGYTLHGALSNGKKTALVRRKLFVEAGIRPEEAGRRIAAELLAEA
ncbi:MAG TPA: hydroxymethylbilane synthase [Acidobacteriaceae bacterium]